VDEKHDDHEKRDRQEGHDAHGYADVGENACVMTSAKDEEIHQQPYFWMRLVVKLGHQQLAAQQMNILMQIADV
jgi:hypothetical protein